MRTGNLEHLMNLVLIGRGLNLGEQHSIFDIQPPDARPQGTEAPGPGRKSIRKSLPGKAPSR